MKYSLSKYSKDLLYGLNKHENFVIQNGSNYDISNLNCKDKKTYIANIESKLDTERSSIMERLKQDQALITKKKNQGLSLNNLEEIPAEIANRIEEYRKVVEHNINKRYKKSAALKVIEEQYNACDIDEMRDESLSDNNKKSLKLQYEIQLSKEKRDWNDYMKNIADIEVEKYKNKLLRDNLASNLNDQKYKINIQSKIDTNNDLNNLKCISKDMYDDVFCNLNYIHTYRKINSVKPASKRNKTLSDLEPKKNYTYDNYYKYKEGNGVELKRRWVKGDLSSRQIKYKEMDDLKQEMIKLFDIVYVETKPTVEKPKEDLSYLEKGNLSAWDKMRIKTDYCNISYDQVIKN
eukprot:Mrub_05317.p1 GENE.Mrub_05317~~Mrub_05317.p1  ORF type:complete len:367 (+),score=66.45 Mrub_05317:56-1102(+)